MTIARKAKIVGTLLLVSAVLAFSSGKGWALQVKLSGDKLTLQAENVPLRDVLARLAQEGIRARMDPQIELTVSASFQDLEIGRGLELILKDLDYALLWESTDGPGSRISKVAEIQVFRPGQKERMKVIGPKNNLDVTRNPEDGSYYVRDEVLLRFKAGKDLKAVEALLAMRGGRIVESFFGLGIVRVRFPPGSDVPALLKELRERLGGENAEPNFAYPMPRSSWDIQRFPLDPSLGPGESPVPVAVIDSGLSPEVRMDRYVLASLDAMNPGHAISDDEGHGTQMALLAAGLVLPIGAAEGSGVQAPIIPIRAFDEKGFTSTFHLIHSIEFAIRNGARVMSLSWGSEVRSEFLGDALESAHLRGLVIVASAGNEPTGKPLYPAAYPSVIGVGALGPDGKPWEKSNSGDFVALYAPGFASLPVGYRGEAGIYAGTSISAAFAANRIASILSANPYASREEIIKALQDQR